jgi:hypothetical protein
MIRTIDKINSMTRTIDKIKVWFFAYFQNSSINDFVRGYGDLRKVATWKQAARRAMFNINRMGVCLEVMVASSDLSSAFGCDWVFEPYQ